MWRENGLFVHLIWKHQNWKIWGKAEFTECAAVKYPRHEATVPRKQHQQVMVTHYIGQNPRHIVADRSFEPNIPFLVNLVIKDIAEAPKDFVTDCCSVSADMKNGQFRPVPSKQCQNSGYMLTIIRTIIRGVQ